ncbi:MAG: hypothetical protein F6J93_14880 [Oscillatoria sp. SIO1A7]|nr:hypothetical protein [Oscillatoria sp. SIO1A7]
MGHGAWGIGNRESGIGNRKSGNCAKNEVDSPVGANGIRPSEWAVGRFAVAR